MFPKIILSTLFGLIAVIIIFLPWTVVSGENEDCVALIEKKCKDCHSTTRICRNLTKDRTEIWWKSNIENMVAYGAKYTDIEQEVFLKCLLKPYVDTQDLCK